MELKAKIYNNKASILSVFESNENETHYHRQKQDIPQTLSIHLINTVNNL